MANGLQIAASGLIAQEWHLDAVANDIANVSTVGYQPVAHRLLRGARHERRRPRRRHRRQRRARLRSRRATTRSRSRSTAPATSRSAPPSGAIALTRDGDLHVDGGAQARAAQRRHARPADRRPGRRRPARRSPSRPTAPSTAAGRTLGKLTLVDVPAPDALAVAQRRPARRRPPAAARRRRRTNASVQQGVLEQSNVDLATALTDMMDAQRSFQLASRALHTQDQLLEIANGIRR